MPDVKDFNYFVSITVHNNVRRAYEFARPFYLSRPTHSGECGQFLDPANNSLGRISCSRRIVFPDVFNSGYKFGPMLRKRLTNPESSGAAG